MLMVVMQLFICLEGVIYVDGGHIILYLFGRSHS